jgi:pyridoxine 4-dehydrogenase
MRNKLYAIVLGLTAFSVAAFRSHLAPDSRSHHVTTLYAASRRKFLDESFGQVILSTSTGLWVPPSSNAIESQITMSKQSIDLPPIGLGAWSWGDAIFWGYNPSQDAELERVFDYAVQASSKLGTKALFDTAELYGLGRSESLIGTFRQNWNDKVLIASKFAALPFRTSSTSVIKACEASVKRLGGQPIDLYQIHFPNSWSNADYWDGLATVYERGLVRAVGVSNYGSDALRACHASLASRGIPLSTNQIQYSLLYRWPELNGLIDTCKELDVKVLAYSPLALGFLTGKYSTSQLPDGPRNSIGKQLFQTPDYENLIQLMKEISSKRVGASVSQVAINWARAKGTIPIPGARTLAQVQQNYDALDWNLSSKEVEMLDLAAESVTSFLTPDKSPFPREDINTHLKMFDS